MLSVREFTIEYGQAALMGRAVSDAITGRPLGTINAIENGLVRWENGKYFYYGTGDEVYVEGS